MATTEFVPAETIWASYSTWTSEQKDAFEKQISAQSINMPVAHMQEMLADAPVDMKLKFWTVWADNVDLSGQSLPEIMKMNGSEPPDAVYVIVQRWLEQVSLSEYDLIQIQKTATMLRGADIPKLWERWVSQADLSAINLVQFCKSIRDLSPKYQAIVLKGYVSKADLSAYNDGEIASAKKYVTKHAAEEAGLQPSEAKKGEPEFQAGDRFTINASWDKRVHTVADMYWNGKWMYQSNLTYGYFSKEVMKRYDE